MCRPTWVVQNHADIFSFLDGETMQCSNAFCVFAVSVFFIWDGEWGWGRGSKIVPHFC